MLENIDNKLNLRSFDRVTAIDETSDTTKLKELDPCHKLKFYNSYFFATQCRRPQIFKTMNSIRSNNLSLKYQWFTPSGCNDIRIRKF